jgi:hypothetical protein
VFGKPAEQLIARSKRFMPIFHGSQTLLTQVPLAVKAFAASRDEPPDNSAADFKRVASGIGTNSIRTERFDASDDLMAQNCRNRDLSTSLKAMQIASTKGAAFNSHQNLCPTWNRRWQMLQLDVAGRSMKDRGE